MRVGLSNHCVKVSSGFILRSYPIQTPVHGGTGIMHKCSRLLGLLLGIFAVHPSIDAKSRVTRYDAVPGEYVLKIKSNALRGDDRVFDRIASRASITMGVRAPVGFRRFLTSRDFATFVIPGVDRAEAIQQLQNDPEVAYAEPNYIYRIVGARDLPTDPQFSGLWGLNNVGQKDSAGQVGNAGSDIHVTPVWNEGVVGSRSIKVAVIDTGVDDTHPDLKVNVDAENGYNFVTGSPVGRDDHNHGTHCAGTIGAAANNGIGVVGVNWNVTIIPIKFLDAQGSGTLENAVQSIQYATRLKVHVMSNSWGGGGYTQSLFDAIDEARKAGIVFVAAAGNESNNNDSRATYPAGYQLDNVISVAAVDNQDKIANFSNYGARTVHVAAPGVKILSTLKGGKYGIMSGTSMATPHVSGIAALLLSANPSMSYAEIKDLLIRSSDPVKGLTKKVLARGRVNVYNALHRIFPASSSAESDHLDQEISALVR